MELRNRKLKTARTLLIGGAIGAGVALLLAPQSGKRTRRELRHLGKKALNKSAAIGMEVRNSIDNLVDEVSDTFRDNFHWTRKAGHGVLSAIGSGGSFIKGTVSKVARAS